MIKPKSIDLTDQEGVTKTYFLSKFPAVEGREIVTKYPISNAPKIGDYAVSRDVMFMLMGYVAVETAPNVFLRLETPALVNNHVTDWETLLRLEFEMLKYNTSFFKSGLNSDFLGSIGPKLQPWLSRILTALLAQSSPPAPIAGEQP